jgi:hypothetical protein
MKNLVIGEREREQTEATTTIEWRAAQQKKGNELLQNAIHSLHIIFRRAEEATLSSSKLYTENENVSIFEYIGL